MPPPPAPPSLFTRAAEVSSIVLLAAAFAIIQVLIGGTRLLFSLPAYAALGVMALLTLALLRRERPAPDQLCLGAAALFFGYVLVRALFSPVAYIARPDIYSVLGGLLVYLFTACFMTTSRARTIFVLFLLGLALVHVAIGALQFRDANNFMLIPWLQRYDYGLRASGFYVCPNHLAGLLEVLGIFALSIVCWSRWPTWSKLLIGYAACMCYAGLVLTGSRGGYLSTLASFGVFGVLSLAVLRRAGSALFWKVGGAGIAAAALLGAALWLFLHQNFYLESRAKDVFETTNMRVDLWKAAIDQWHLQPLVGTGSGTYLFYGREFRTPRMQMDPVEVHNDYLHLLAEYGLVGALTMLAFLAVHLRRGWKSFERLGPKRVAVAPRLLSNGLALNVAALASVAAYVVHSIFDFNLHIPANVLLLAFVFGILANAGSYWDQQRPAPSAALLAWRLALPALGLLAIVQASRLLPGEYFAERARTALRDGSPASAIFYGLRGIEAEKSNPELYFYLGSARAQLGANVRDPRAAASFYSTAIADLRKARALAPQDDVYALELAFNFDALRDFDAAEQMYRAAAALDPRSTSVRRYYEAHRAAAQSHRSAEAPPQDDAVEAP